MAKSRKNRVKTNLKDTLRQNAAQVEIRAYSGSDFNPDYGDILKDLKRIGTLAGIFLALMLVLSFFIG